MDQDIEDFKSGMNLNYFGTLNVVKVIIFVSNRLTVYNN